ncbi:RING finger and transmembrane domain-containing protein 2-like [Trifolium pratense]|uniref:Uncharacterized protein n=2 Tax=Trifolium pratense TaxID=57577 RepID=A0ACB0LRK5_TRIPR|nr:RING finger and transmembrane domain-containing protein 2-like [Trifolium pratense]CAJ2671049.1 unnamed protein product [Trifolium pratense]
MEGNGASSASSSSSNSRRYGFPSAASIIQAPLSALLEYSGMLPSRSNQHQHQPNPDSVPNNDEVSIRIIGSTEQDNHREEESIPLVVNDGATTAGMTSSPSHEDVERTGGGNVDAEEGGGGGDGGGANGRDSSYQRYDIQHAARWIEQVLPFSLLLLVVFIRQHLQGFFVTIWIAAVLFKSNDILRKQTALKGERKMPVLIGISVAFALHVVGVYWWYQNDDLMYPLVMLPPKEIPPFWHAIFIIMVNDTLARQAAMVLKCILLMYYKNSRGRNYRKQGQMLTLVEYLLLLYRALLPAPVWYRFFLNKEYGSLFSSLMTGLYLTFKLTSVVEKVQSFFASVKALSRKEVHYGAYATSEQVIAAGDLCAICQEKMHAPILLRCKHIFCEDCVSEWFERERTCPLCRALVKPADLRSFGDGSTSLFFQLF